MITNNCRDFSALCLAIMYPSKMDAGFDALTDCNALALTIRHRMENKATTIIAIIGTALISYSLTYMIIHREYITRQYSHFFKNDENTRFRFFNGWQPSRRYLFYGTRFFRVISGEILILYFSFAQQRIDSNLLGYFGSPSGHCFGTG